MGPVIAIVAIAAVAFVAELITDAILRDMQQQIDDIINFHRDDTTILQNLQKLLEKIDFAKIYDAINKMHKDMGSKFK